MRFANGFQLADGYKVSTQMLALSATIGAILSGAPVVAAESTGDSAGLEEVVVTANKLNSQKVLDLPISIQAISGDSLQRAGSVAFMDIAGQVPGLSVQDLGPGDKKYVIRGINSTGDSTTGIYYGEAVISGSNGDDGGGFQPDIRLFDLDRIEVLRGPQGTLYGASSMSGTIRFIPKSPDLNSLGGYLTLEGSQTAHASGNYNFNGAINLPIIEGVLALRLVGWKVDDSGYINQVRVGQGVTGLVNVGTATNPNYQSASIPGVGFIKGVNDDNVGGGRVMIRYQPTDNLTIDANYTSQSETSGGSSRYTPAGVAAFNGGPILADAGLRPVQHRCHAKSLERQHQGVWPDGGIQDRHRHGDRHHQSIQSQHRLHFRFDAGSGVLRCSGPCRDSRAAHAQGQLQRSTLCQRSEFPRQFRGGRVS